MPTLKFGEEITYNALRVASAALDTFTIIPIDTIFNLGLFGKEVIPLVSPTNFHKLKQMKKNPMIVELENGDDSSFLEIQSMFPDTLIIMRLEFGDPNLLSYFQAGTRIFHLTANYHGRNRKGDFVLELIREAHALFVNEKCRDEVTLIGSGGMIAAEHIPKAIICGLDVVALDTPILTALQVSFGGNCLSTNDHSFKLPSNLYVEWATQRIINLIGSWRDQLLEILGAMGLREVRRLRGEMGRAMFQKDLEEDAFSNIAGYGS
jgi:hypothetical protein